MVVKPSPKQKRVLTDHQKDDDIPDLYGELSRDDSIIQLLLEFASQDSMSMSVPDNDKPAEASDNFKSPEAVEKDVKPPEVDKRYS